MSVCFTHPGGSYVHTRRERFDVALGLRVINYVWRHRDLQRACVRGIHVYVGCACVCVRAHARYTYIRGMWVCARAHDRDKRKKT